MSDQEELITISSGEEDFYLEKVNKENDQIKVEIISDSDESIEQAHSGLNHNISRVKPECKYESTSSEESACDDIDTGYESPLEEISFCKNNNQVPILKDTDVEFSPQALVDLLVSRKTRRIATK